jgi:hypothetical protein
MTAYSEDTSRSGATFGVIQSILYGICETSQHFFLRQRKEVISLYMSGQSRLSKSDSNSAGTGMSTATIYTRGSIVRIDGAFNSKGSDERSDAGDDETGEFAQRLLSIEKDASSLLEKLADEFQSVKDKIVSKAETELKHAQDIIEKNRAGAVDALERDYLEKRNAINDAAHAQLQLVYTLARAEEQTRKSLVSRGSIRSSGSGRNSFSFPPVVMNNHDPTLRASFSYQDQTRQFGSMGLPPNPSVLFESPFSSSLKLPVIYDKPYDIPTTYTITGGYYPRQ